MGGARLWMPGRSWAKLPRTSLSSVASLGKWQVNARLRVILAGFIAPYRGLRMRHRLCFARKNRNTKGHSHAPPYEGTKPRRVCGP